MITLYIVMDMAKHPLTQQAAQQAICSALLIDMLLIACLGCFAAYAFECIFGTKRERERRAWQRDRARRRARSEQEAKRRRHAWQRDMERRYREIGMRWDRY
jgi:hypothetical protein